LCTEQESTSSATAGLAYLDYLTKTWLTEPLWQNWSQFRRIQAANALGITIQKVAPTTNHLEALNSVLKRKHIRRFQKGGRRLRFDLLIHLLVTRILPGIFQQRQVETEYYNWLSSRFLKQAGGHDLVQTRWDQREATKIAKVSSNYTPENPHPFTWWPSESQLQHQEEAMYIIKKRRIGEFHWLDSLTLSATCASSLVSICLPGHTRYQLILNCYGWGICSCPYFSKFGVACKHLWAFRFVAVQMRTQYSFVFPMTEHEAAAIYYMLFKIDSTSSLPILIEQPLCPPPLPNHSASTCIAAEDVIEIFGEVINNTETCMQGDDSSSSESEEDVSHSKVSSLLILLTVSITSQIDFIYSDNFYECSN